MFNALNRRVVVASGLIVLGGFGALRIAAQAPAAAREKLTFLAIGTDGQPIADLKAAQLELKIDGKVRPVQSLQLVKIAGGSADAAGAAAGPKGMFDASVPAPFGLNSATPSRNVMIVIDEESMRPGADKPIKDALDQFAGSLGPQDQIALNTIPHGTVSVPMSTSKSNVRDALGKVAGRLPPNRNDTDDVCHARDVSDTLTSIMMSLGEGPTTVVFISSGLVAPSSSTSRSSTTGSRTCDLTPSELDKLGKATSAGRATTYVIVGETNVPTTEMAGLQSFAGAVGSPVLNLANPDPPFTRILRESGNYYVAEFDADAAEHDGKTHRVDLKLTAPGTLRVASELTLAKATSAKPSAKDIVKETKIYTDLPLRAVGLVSKGTGDKIKILAIVEAVDPSVKFSSMSIGLVSLADSSGKITTGSLSAEELAKPMAVSAMEVAPGAYRMHVAAVDATGRIGSVDYPVDATLTPSGPMKLSGLALGTMSPGFAPKMLFTDEPEAIAYFELYGTTTSPISAGVEIAETPDGPAIKSGDPQLAQTSEPGRYNCVAKLDIKDLKPGDYVVRAIFGVEGNPPGKIFRTLRKVAK